MASLRDLGYKIMSLVNDNDSRKQELCSKLNFSLIDLNRLIYGRLSVTPVQLKTIANTLSVPVEELINYNNNDSYKNMVHCMSSFSTHEHCKEVLDIIDSYIDIKEAVC
jgi:DNA-binding Xre family transcriptional regulator